MFHVGPRWNIERESASKCFSKPILSIINSCSPNWSGKDQNITIDLCQLLQFATATPSVRSASTHRDKIMCKVSGTPSIELEEEKTGQSIVSNLNRSAVGASPKLQQMVRPRISHFWFAKILALPLLTSPKTYCHSKSFASCDSEFETSLRIWLKCSHYAKEFDCQTEKIAEKIPNALHIHCTFSLSSSWVWYYTRQYIAFILPKSDLNNSEAY